MMLGDGVNKKSEQKSIIGDMETVEKPLSPLILSPSKERMTIKIPKKSKIFRLLEGDKDTNKLAYWEKLDRLVTIADLAEEEMADRLFNEFLVRMELYYPDKIEKLKTLRALILYRIICGEELPEKYYKILEKL